MNTEDARWNVQGPDVRRCQRCSDRLPMGWLHDYCKKCSEEAVVLVFPRLGKQA